MHIFRYVQKICIGPERLRNLHYIFNLLFCVQVITLPSMKKILALQMRSFHFRTKNLTELLFMTIQ